MTTFECLRCGAQNGTVRLVEHGHDDAALCKICFRKLVERAEGHESAPWGWTG